MKKMKMVAGAFVALFAMAMASCSSDDNNVAEAPQGTALDMKLFKAAKVNCSSNDYTLTEWESDYIKVVDSENAEPKDRPNALNVFFDKRPLTTDRGENVSTDEMNFVLNYLENNPNAGSKEFNHYNYYIQFVGGAGKSYATTPDMNGALHTVDNATNKMQQIFIKVEGRDDYIHLNDYNASGGKRTLLLNKKIVDVMYNENYGDKNQQKYGYYQFYEIEYNGEKNLYLCFDYTTEKNNGEFLAADGVYDDYVIKIVPCCNEEEEPTTPEEEEPTTPGEDEPVVTPEPLKGSVEINLSSNDHKDENSSKLSVHVRDTTDFEVFIPVPENYYCQQDDMFIVEQHKGEKYTYKHLEETVTREFNIDGKQYTVTLSISYASDGITVKSEGINAEILKYCRNVYGDGISFEVYNYYNLSITRAELIALLNQAEVTFENEPGEYINTIRTETEKVDAEGKKVLDADGNAIMVPNTDAEGNLLDCTVTKK